MMKASVWNESVGLSHCAGWKDSRDENQENHSEG